MYLLTGNQEDAAAAFGPLGELGLQDVSLAFDVNTAKIELSATGSPHVPAGEDIVTSFIQWLGEETVM